MRFRATFFLLAALAVARLGYDRAFNRGDGATPLLRPLSEFPLVSPEGAEGRDQPLTPEVIRKAGVSEHLNRRYRFAGMNLWLYVGYHDGSRVEKIHQPEVCLPGSGWEAREREVLSFGSTSGRPLAFNLIRFLQGDRLLLSAYTFYYRGRYEPGESAIDWGRAFGPRNFAIIIVSIEAAPAGVPRAREVLERFIQAQVPRLEGFLPGAAGDRGRSPPSPEGTVR